MCPKGTTPIAAARASRDTGGLGSPEDCPGKAGHHCDLAGGGQGQVCAAGREACHVGNSTDQDGGVCTASEACRVGTDREASSVRDDCEAGTGAREARAVNGDREARATRSD